MNKAELIEVVAARIDASKKDAGEAVQAVVDAITEAVAKGQKVSISGFGVFERAARPARTYRTPSTGEAIQKLATSVPKFRPGGDFRAFVSGDKNLAELTKRAEDVIRRVTGQGGSEPETPASATKEPSAETKAPAKRATSAAKKTTTAKTATAKRTTAKKAAPRKTAAKSAASGDTPAKRTTTRKSSTAAKKAPAKRAPRKTAAPAAEATAGSDS